MATPVSVQSIVSVDPEVMSGAPVFAGTRVPVKTLFEYLAAGDPIEEFFDGFPSVSRESALAVIAEAGCALVELHARPD